MDEFKESNQDDVMRAETTASLYSIIIMTFVTTTRASYVK